MLAAALYHYRKLEKCPILKVTQRPIDYSYLLPAI